MLRLIDWLLGLSIIISAECTRSVSTAAERIREVRMRSIGAGIAKKSIAIDLSIFRGIKVDCNTN